jgi:hypothetical protein
MTKEEQWFRFKVMPKMLELKWAQDFFQSIALNRAFIKCSVSCTAMKDGNRCTIYVRIQEVKGPVKKFNTFTVRSRENGSTERTEATRLIEAYGSGHVPEGYLLQVYVNEGGTEVLSMAMVELKDIAYQLAHHPTEFREQIVGADGNQFIVMPWGKMTELGADTLISYDKEEAMQKKFEFNK